jgi:hypothetical protein
MTIITHEQIKWSTKPSNRVKFLADFMFSLSPLHHPTFYCINLIGFIYHIDKDRVSYTILKHANLSFRPSGEIFVFIRMKDSSLRLE